MTGKDDTLCSDHQQFDWKYPGQLLKDLLRYGEPEWPDRDRDGLERSGTSVTETDPVSVVTTGLTVAERRTVEADLSCGWESKIVLDAGLSGRR